MHRLRAAVVLMLTLAACAPPGSAGSLADPELADPAGDHEVEGDLQQVPDPVPPIPGVNDQAFDDIDLLAAYFEQVGPNTRLTVVTSAPWQGGNLAGSFNVTRGPTSYANSTATAAGRAVLFWVNGTTLAGLQGTAGATTEGLRITFATAQLAAVGGDLLADLRLSAMRRDAGNVEDPQVTQDDLVGTDEAGPGAAYMVARPPPVAQAGLRVVQVGNATGNRAETAVREPLRVTVEVTNLGSDPATLTVRAGAVESLAFAGGPLGTFELAPLASARANVTVSLEEAERGTHTVPFFLGDDPTADATATIVYAPAAVPREVKPAGLDWLTPATEATGFDDAFGSYGEAALLALLVLVAILAVFLLVAPAPSTLAGTPEPIAPPVVGGDGAPGGVLGAAADDASAAGPRVTRKRKPGVPAPAEPPSAKAAAAAAAVAVPAPPPPAEAGLRIEEVSHKPDDPAPGEDVATEVVLRNDGTTRQVRVVLAVDGNDADEAALTLPARATKTVRLGWTAGEGENRVRVRVLPA